MKHELTVTLRPVLYSKTANQQFEITAPYMKTALFPYKATIIAELTQEHNVHYHCLVEIDGIVEKEKLLNRFRQFNKHLGRKTCTAVQFEESYEKYMVKSYWETTKIITDPFVKDDYKLSNLLTKSLFEGAPSRSSCNPVGCNARAPGRAAATPTEPNNLINYLNNNYNI